MSLTYSTRQERSDGPVYSTGRSAGRPGVVAMAGPTQPPLSQRRVPLAPARRCHFRLSPQGLPLLLQDAAGASGSVLLEGTPGSEYRVVAELVGLPPLRDPSVQLVLWLIHDLVVPADLAPSDWTALPRGASGGGNTPGMPFTFDGNPPTYGPRSNTLPLAISPGRFTPTQSGSWRLEATLDAGVNQALHPLYFLGPAALPEMNAALPSGTAAAILTDLVMRPATVYPELPMQSHPLDRMRAVAARHLAPDRPASLLDPSTFNRAAVTLEGPVRATPILMPTAEAAVLLGQVREDG